MDAPSVGRIGDYIKEQREHASLSLRRLAAEAGVSNPYLSQVERGLRKPSAEILQQLARALRISAEQLYVQAGLLEDKGASLAVQTAIFNDLLTTERQKQVMLDIYTSFLHENGVEDDPRAVTPRKPARSTAKSAKPSTKKTAKKTTAKKSAAKKSAKPAAKKVSKKSSARQSHTSTTRSARQSTK